MLFKLALKNIKEKKLRTFLASISIVIGTASLILFLGLSNGIQNATFEELEKKNPLTQITVRPKIEERGVISLLTQSEKGTLTQKSVDEISKIEGIQNIYPEIQFENLSSIEVDLLGMSLITDTMIYGVPAGFVEQDIKSKEIWEKSSEPYPAIIPRKLLDLYNIAIAYPQGLPVISEDGLLGKELTLYPNHSIFFPGMSAKNDIIKLEIAGFSDKINLLGATLPYEIVEDLNKEYSTSTNSKFLELFVETEKASQTPQIAGQIEALGYNTQYYQKNLKEVEAKFTYLKISLGTISAIILITAAIAIISTFLATVIERTKEIGLFRALGATKRHIKMLILIEAGILGILGSLGGTILGTLLSKIVDQIGLKQLETTTFSAQTLFQININLILFTIIFGTILSILSAYLPAKKASNIDPIEALKF